MKMPRHHPYELLKMLPNRERPWKFISWTLLWISHILRALWLIDLQRWQASYNVMRALVVKKYLTLLYMRIVNIIVSR